MTRPNSPWVRWIDATMYANGKHGWDKVSKPTTAWRQLNISNSSFRMTIYSHVTSNNISVTVCKIDEGWSIRTAPLTSQGAERELQDLLQRLDQV